MSRRENEFQSSKRMKQKEIKRWKKKKRRRG